MSIQQTISQLANQCVLCGLCLPHCPTYQIFHTENESPRGRIALFKAVAEAKLEINEALILPLEHCLSCRACEKMCPSQVKYAQINHLGRQIIASNAKADILQKQYSWQQNLSEKLLLTPVLHPLLKFSARLISPLVSLLYQKKALSSNQSLIKTFSHELIRDTDKLKNNYSINDASEVQGTVLIFKGCSSELFEQQTILDSIKLLNACHFNVSIPENQSCCGAIKLRHGDHKGMLLQAQHNIELFTPHLSNIKKSKTKESNNKEAKDYDAIISLNNSCSAQLKEYALLEHADISDNAKIFADKTFDLIAFLHQKIKISQLKFAPLDQQVAIHTTCSLKNVLKEEQLLYDLLELIPEIKLHRLDSQYCCGAAGSYMLQYPKVSNQLLNDKLEDIQHNNHQLIVSSNIGCTLHFKQGLNQSGQKVEVIHPVSLLSRQLLN